jgi:hypothetical protein
MMQFLRLFYSGEGQGNIGYDIPPASAAGVLNAANDGLSTDLATGKIAQLGQTVNRPGDPAILLQDREIPNPGGFTVFFGKNNGIANVVGINSDFGISVANNNLIGFQYFDGAKNFTIEMPSATTILMRWGAGTITFDTVTGVFTFNDAIHTTGLGTSIVTSAAAIINVTRNNFTYLIDTTAGNVVVNMDPAILAGQIFDFKKISADANSITLTPTAGTIMDIPPAVASLAFSDPGASITVHCDGTNFFVI